jgi:hypothetical protein
MFWTYHLGKRVCEVNAGALAEAMHHPTHLVALKCTIRKQLLLEYSFAGDEVGLGRIGNELPSLVLLQSVELLLHGLMPMQVPKRCPSGDGNRRERRCRGRARVLGGGVASGRPMDTCSCMSDDPRGRTWRRSSR